jgi:outer membrane protein
MKRLFPAVVGVAAVALCAGQAAAMDMTQALSEAYNTNPTLQAQRAKVRATDEEVGKAVAGWRPTISLEGDAGPVVKESNTGTPSTAKDQHRDLRSVFLTAKWPLYSGGKTTDLTSQAENTVLAERARLNSVEQSTLLNVATAYVNVVRDQATVQLGMNNEEVLGKQLGATRDRFRVGEVTRTDVAQGESRLAGSTSDRINAEGTLEQSRVAFRNVVGLPPGNNLQAPPIPADLPKDLDGALKVAVDNHPDILAAEFDEASAKNNVDAIRDELLPSLSLNGTASRELQNSSEISRLNTVQGLFVLTIPLYSSGSVESRLRQAKQSAGQARLKSDQVRRDVTATVTSAWEALATARSRIQSFNSQISASGVALEGVQRENAVGSRTFLDVLDAEQELLNARVNLVRAQRDEVVAAFQLQAAIGRLDARSLELPVGYYDPLYHYNEVRNKWFGYSSSGDDVGTTSSMPAGPAQ